MHQDADMAMPIAVNESETAKYGGQLWRSASISRDATRESHGATPPNKKAGARPAFCRSLKC